MWQAVEVPETVNSVGYGASLALDGAGKAHIAHKDESANKLHCVTNKGGSWVSKTFASTSNDGNYASIVLNPAGCVYIAYTNVSTNDVWMVSDVSEPGTRLG